MNRCPLITGNHDKFENVSKYFNRENTRELFYSLKDDSRHYIFLDSSLEEVSSTQLDWLRKDERIHGNIRQVITHAVSFQVDKLAPEIVIKNDSFGYKVIEIGREIATEKVTF